MLINIRTTGRLLPEELASKLNTLGYPAVLLDKTLRMVAKNRESLEFAPFLRRGAKINRYLPEGDDIKVAEMKPCDTFITSVSSDGTGCRVNIVCGVDCRLVIFQPVSAGLCAGVLDKYGKMSGYDADINEPDLAGSSNKSRNRLSAGMVNIIESVNSRQSELFALPFFNSAAVLRRLLGEIERLSARRTRQIRLSLSADELISEGSEKDFILMMAFMISFCLENSDGEEVSVNAENRVGELVFNISCRSDVSVYGIAKLASFRKGFADMDAVLDEPDFWAYMLKLLADVNLWDISVCSDGGRLSFTLRTPYVKSGEEFMVRDVSQEFVRQVVAEVFGLSLKRY